MISSFVNSVDGLLDFFSTKLKSSISDYCDIETVDSESTLVSKDGSLLSIIKIQGVKNLINSDSLVQDIVLPLNTAIQSNFDNKGHMIQMWFQVDPDNTQRELQKILNPARITAEKLRMDMDDLLSERESNLTNWTASESCFMVLWTKSDLLTKSDRKRSNARVKKERLNISANTSNGQDPVRSIKELRDSHQSFVESFRSQLSASGINTDILNVHAAMREMRKSVDTHFTDEEWMASLPGDKILPSVRKKTPNKEEYDIVWPKIGWQLCPRDGNIVGDNVVKIGDRIYSPIYIDLFPREIQTFAHLFERTKEKKLPWRISFLLEGDGLSSFGFKGLAAQLLGFANSGNKMIHKGVEELKSLKDDSGETIVRIRAALSTWAPKNEPELLSKRVSELAKCVESWGSCQVSEVTGDPMAGVSSSSLAFTQGNIGTKTAIPLVEALTMMPWARPSSPWPTGAVTFRTPDGKLMPYQPYSSLQTTWINLIFAKPGSGKSVLMNMFNLALCLSPGLERLPRISIIDIGPSSSGLISLLKEALPPEMRELVMHHRLQMVERDAINPFDTQLGCRYPTPLEESFLRNFMTLLVTDVSTDKPEKSMAALVTDVIKEMYSKYSDRNEPHPYSVGTSLRTDAAIKKYNIKIDSKTSWWEVVDELFNAGDISEAKIAQRHAVPLLSDATSCAKSEKLRRIYDGTSVEGTGESLIEYFSRSIATALNMYPIMARPTAFDVGVARIVALDLDDVAKSGGAVSDRMTAVMYMLARQVLAKDYYINEEVVQDMPAPADIPLRESVPVKKYKAYHYEQIRNIKEDPKRICYDEFHRTSKAIQVREQVVLDMREGRKFSVDVMLSSQELSDFDSSMKSFATGIFIMDSGNAADQEKIAESFGLTDVERSVLKHKVHPPRRGGGTFLTKFSTTSGWYTMLLSATLGPIELWAFSTTTEDVAIRNRMYKEIGPKLARRVLAAKYPNGSAKSEIEDRREKQRNSRTSIMDEDDDENIYDKIVRELIQYAEDKNIID